MAPFDLDTNVFLTASWECYLKYGRDAACVQDGLHVYDFARMLVTPRGSSGPAVAFAPLDGCEPLDPLPADQSPASLATTQTQASLLTNPDVVCRWYYWFPQDYNTVFLFKEKQETVRWRAYPPEVCWKIEQARAEGKKVVEINAIWAVSWESGTYTQHKIEQWNLRRTVRSVPYFWMYDAGNCGPEDAKMWKPFHPSISAIIETALVTQEATARYEVNGQLYTADIIQMCQFRDGDKFRRRNVMRVGGRLNDNHMAKLRVRNTVVSFADRFPSYWQSMGRTETGRPLLVDVDLPSQEGVEIIEYMNRKIGDHARMYGWGPGISTDPAERRTRFFDVSRILRIEDREHWRWFIENAAQIREKWPNLPQMKCSQVLAEHPLLTECLDPSTNQYRLWHGTSPVFIRKVMDGTAFDTRVVRCEGNMFGAGLYFADLASKANQYVPCPGCNLGSVATGQPCTCTQQQGQPCAMLLCRVNLGNFLVSRENSENLALLRDPPVEDGVQYDSLMGESREWGGKQLNNREHVVYDRSQVIPEYVVWYFRKNQSP